MITPELVVRQGDSGANGVATKKSILATEIAEIPRGVILSSTKNLFFYPQISQIHANYHEFL